MTSKSSLVFVISLALAGFPCALKSSAEPRPQNKVEPWQTDLKLYVGELGKDLQKGIDPGDDARFKGKVVEFEGTLRKALDPAQPDDEPEIEFEPRQITVMLKLFPGVDQQKAGDKTVTVTLKQVFVKPADLSRDAWKALQAGSRVRFRATVEHDAAVLVTTSDTGGLVILFLHSGEVLPAK